MTRIAASAVDEVGFMHPPLDPSIAPIVAAMMTGRRALHPSGFDGRGQEPTLAARLG